MEHQIWNTFLFKIALVFVITEFINWFFKSAELKIWIFGLIEEILLNYQVWRHPWRGRPLRRVPFVRVHGGPTFKVLWKLILFTKITIVIKPFIELIQILFLNEEWQQIRTYCWCCKDKKTLEEYAFHLTWHLRKGWWLSYQNRIPHSCSIKLFSASQINNMEVNADFKNKNNL